MTIIQEYILNFCHQLDIYLPLGSQILSVCELHDRILMIIMCDYKEAKYKHREIMMFNSNQEIDSSVTAYIGSVIRDYPDGTTKVWHVFEKENFSSESGS